MEWEASGREWGRWEGRAQECTRRWREKGDTEEAKWKFSAILEVEGGKGWVGV
jgi:hypothetical protein